MVCEEEGIHNDAEWLLLGQGIISAHKCSILRRLHKDSCEIEKLLWSFTKVLNLKKIEKMDIKRYAKNVLILGKMGSVFMVRSSKHTCFVET